MENYLKDKNRKVCEDCIVFDIRVPRIDTLSDQIYYENCKIIKSTTTSPSKDYSGFIFEDSSGKRHNMPKLDEEGTKYGLEFANNLKCTLLFSENGSVEFHYDTKDKKVIAENADGTPRFFKYTDGRRTTSMDYCNTDNTARKRFEAENIVEEEIFKNNKLSKKTQTVKSSNAERVFEYRKDGTKKYTIVRKDGKEICSSFYLSSNQAEPVFTELMNIDGRVFTIFDPKTKERAKIKLSEDFGHIIETKPDKEKCKRIINGVFNTSLQETDFLNDNLGQTLANMYMFANFDDKKTFLNFYSEEKQPKTLRDFQRKYFSDDDKTEFKVGIIANKNRNHSLCLVIPNPKKYPGEKAILFDSNFLEKYKTHDNIYTDVDKELAKDVEVINSSNMQHGRSCTLFALSAVDLLEKNKTFFDIRSRFTDVQASRNFKIPTDFEEEIAENIKTKYTTQKPMVDVYGDDMFSYDFKNDLKKKVELYRSRMHTVNYEQNNQLERIRRKKAQKNNYYRKQLKKHRLHNITNANSR